MASVVSATANNNLWPDRLVGVEKEVAEVTKTPREISSLICAYIAKDNMRFLGVFHWSEREINFCGGIVDTETWACQEVTVSQKIVYDLTSATPELSAPHRAPTLWQSKVHIPKSCSYLRFFSDYLMMFASARKTEPYLMVVTHHHPDESYYRFETFIDCHVVTQLQQDPIPRPIHFMLRDNHDEYTTDQALLTGPSTRQAFLDESNPLKFNQPPPKKASVNMVQLLEPSSNDWG